MPREKVEKGLPRASPGRTKQGWGVISFIIGQMWGDDLNISTPKFTGQLDAPEKATELQQKTLVHFISKDGMEQVSVPEAGKRLGTQEGDPTMMKVHEPSSAALLMLEFPRGMFAWHLLEQKKMVVLHVN